MWYVTPKAQRLPIRTLKNGQVELLNGFLEGIHHKTKVLKRHAFGCRRFDHFRAKI